MLRHFSHEAVAPITCRMRHFKTWLLTIALVSVIAEAIAAAAVFWHGGSPLRRS